MDAEVVCKEVIVSNLTRRGQGKNHSPIRVITQVFEKDGTMIAEHDPTPETFALFDLIHFARWVKEKKWDADKLTVDVVYKWLDSIEKK